MSDHRSALCVVETIDGPCVGWIVDGTVHRAVGLESWQAALDVGLDDLLTGPAVFGDPVGHLKTCRLHAPVTAAAKIICIGRNFAEHAAEAGGPASAEAPSLFIRFPDAHVGHGQSIIRPAESDWFDWEGELGVVIGRAGSRISSERALEHVAGYTCFGDHSIRDWQLHNQQVTPGKNFRATGAIGPGIVARDAVGNLAPLALTTRLNGQVMQHARLGEMIHDVPAAIAYVSAFTDLRPGDVIAMGTPSGIGGRRQPPIWLKPGDLLEIDIAGIGTLSNPVADDLARTIAQEGSKA